MKRMIWIAMPCLLIACANDLDGDGWDDTTDCNDLDASVNPGATESCNVIDDDCDGVVDEDVTGAPTWFADIDGDGFGDDADTLTSCFQPIGYVSRGGDCDDASARYHPGAAEQDCADPADYNCDESVGYADADSDGFAACEDCDDGDGDLTVPVTWHLDADGDGFGGAVTLLACAAAAGWVTPALATDCDDTDALVHPGAAERCNGLDDDCNTLDDDGFTDADSDDVADCVDACPAWVDPAVVDDTDADGSPAAPFPSIAAAMAGAEEGCTQLTLKPGVYRETVDYGGVDWQIVGREGPELTIIAPPSGPGVIFQSGETDDALLEGVTVRGGTGFPGDGRAIGSVCALLEGWTWGGNILVVNAYPVLRDLVIEDGNATQGGGIYLAAADAQIEDSVFRNNRAAVGGGVSSCSYGNDNVLSGNVFVGNRASANGGAYSGWHGRDALIGNWFEANTTADGVAEGSTVRVTGEQLVANNVVVGNFGNGLRKDYSQHAAIVNNVVLGNTGHGIVGWHNVADPPGASTSTVLNNLVVQNGGCGLYQAGEHVMTARHNLSWGNGEDEWCFLEDLTGVDGNLEQDPKLFAPLLPDVRLLDDSPAINAGEDVSAWVTEAFDGGSRALGTTDIGAFERDAPQL